MLDLMAVSSDDGRVPLYLHTVYRILREMRLVQQEIGGTFDYSQFKTKILSSGLTPQQLAPLQQRLETLESFMPSSQTPNLSQFDLKPEKKGKKDKPKGTNWTSKVCGHNIFFGRLANITRLDC